MAMAGASFFLPHSVSAFRNIFWRQIADDELMRLYVYGYRSLITTMLDELFNSHLQQCHSVMIHFGGAVLYPPEVVPSDASGQSQLPSSVVEQLWSYSSLKANPSTLPFVNLVDAIVSWLHRTDNRNDGIFCSLFTMTLANCSHF